MTAFILAGIVAAITLGLVLSGPKPSSPRVIMGVGFTTAALIASTHWLGW